MWNRPSKEQLALEFQLEHQNKGLRIWKNVEDFLAAAEIAQEVEITPGVDKNISYRSHTRSKKQLINLVSGYRSWPEFRNEKTIDNLYDRISKREPMDMPIVLKAKDGFMRVFSGNTRMDVAFQLGVNPTVLLIEVDKIY